MIRQIEIVTRDHKYAPIKYKTVAAVGNDLIIHRMAQNIKYYSLDFSGCYTVTHEHSGYRVARCWNLLEAKKCRDELLSLNIDWSIKNRHGIRGQAENVDVASIIKKYDIDFISKEEIDPYI